MENLRFALAVTALLLLMIGLGTFGAWVTGVFNPIGYLGVRPWNVPTCEHGVKVGGMGKCDHLATVDQRFSQD